MRILSAKYVLPVSSGPITNGAVAFDRGIITMAGPADELKRQFPEAVHEDLGEAAILPGFVNCHSHLEITAMRGALDDVEHDFRSWLLKLTAMRSEMPDEFIEKAAVAGAIEGLRGGVTCFGDIGRSGFAGLRALKETGLRGVLFQETEFSPDDRTADDDIALLSQKYHKLSEEANERIDIGLSPHSPYTVSFRLFEKIAEFAATEAIRTTIHAAESAEERELLMNGHGLFTSFLERAGIKWNDPKCTSIEYLRRTGILDVRPLLAHCVTVSDADIAAIRESGSSIAHCPCSNAKFGHGYAPLAKFRDAGIAVGLGSDSVSSNNTCDILAESRFAALAARNHPSSAAFISPGEMIEMATLGGAKALGLDGRIGTLDAGKQADIAVVSLANLAQMPVHDVCSALVFASNARDVVMTIVDGEILYRDGKCLSVDERLYRLTAI